MTEVSLYLPQVMETRVHIKPYSQAVEEEVSFCFSTRVSLTLSWVYPTLISASCLSGKWIYQLGSCRNQCFSPRVLHCFELILYTGDQERLLLFASGKYQACKCYVREFQSAAGNEIFNQNHLTSSSVFFPFHHASFLHFSFTLLCYSKEFLYVHVRGYALCQFLGMSR